MPVVSEKANLVYVGLWYGRTNRLVEIASGTAIWYRGGVPPVPIMVWNHMKRSGTARSPLAKGESLHDRIDVELLQIQQNRTLVRSFFRAESVSYISD